MSIEFNEKRWDRLRERWGAWWRGEISDPMVVIEHKLSGYPSGVPGFVNQLPLETPAERVIDIYDAALSQTRWSGDAWPRWFPNFGPGIIAGFLGAKVLPSTDTVWFEPDGPFDIEKHSFLFDAENAWWKRVLLVTEAGVKRWGDQVNVSISDIGGGLDILSFFRTAENLLLDLYDRPEAVGRVTSELAGLWLDYFDRLNAVTSRSGRGCSSWASVWSEGPNYMLQCDFSYMISPGMFESYVLPELRACCGHLNQSFYHLDGVGEIRHLEHLLGLEDLDGIQWVHGDGQPSHAHWIELLGRIREGGKLCQLYITAADAVAVAKALGGKGFAFYILDNLTEGQASELIEDLKVESKK